MPISIRLVERPPLKQEVKIDRYALGIYATVSCDTLRVRPLPLKVTSFYFGASPASGRRVKRKKRRVIRRAVVGAFRCSGSEVCFVVLTFYVRNLHLIGADAENSRKIVAKAAFRS